MIEVRSSKVALPVQTGRGRGKGPSPRFRKACLRLRSRAVGEYSADCHPERDGALSWICTDEVRMKP